MMTGDFKWCDDVEEQLRRLRIEKLEKYINGLEANFERARLADQQKRIEELEKDRAARASHTD